MAQLGVFSRKSGKEEQVTQKPASRKKSHRDAGLDRSADRSSPGSGAVDGGGPVYLLGAAGNAVPPYLFILNRNFSVERNVC